MGICCGKTNQGQKDQQAPVQPKKLEPPAPIMEEYKKLLKVANPESLNEHELAAGISVFKAFMHAQPGHSDRPKVEEKLKALEFEQKVRDKMRQSQTNQPRVSMP